MGHQLGHPSPQLLHRLVSAIHLPISSKSLSTFSCNSCSHNKMQKLSLFKSTLSSEFPFQLVYFDVWRSLVDTMHGYKYYVIFLDHFTKYMWLYPLNKKFEFGTYLFGSKLYLIFFFNSSIIQLYTNNGWEYIALQDFFGQNGISHLITPPHTPKHIENLELRHRHIVEIGLTMLYHAFMPLSFW